MKLLRLLGLSLALTLVAGQAWAEVTVTFYAHPGHRVRGGTLLFPHAYMTVKGNLDATGEAVDWAAGFTARDPGPALLMMTGAGVVAEPEVQYRDEGKAYLTRTVDDATYRSLYERVAFWRSREGSTYDLRRRNCITFIADVMRAVGLKTGAEPSMSPGRFFEESVRLNPEAVVAQAPQAVEG